MGYVTFPGEAEFPVAYCAPGRKLAAAMTLMLNGENKTRIVEHPWLEGRTDVLIVLTSPGSGLVCGDIT